MRTVSPPSSAVGGVAIAAQPMRTLPPSAGSSRTQYQAAKKGSPFSAIMRVKASRVSSSRSGGGQDPGTAASSSLASFSRSLLRVSRVAGIMSRRSVRMRVGFIRFTTRVGLSMGGYYHLWNPRGFPGGSDPAGAPPSQGGRQSFPSQTLFLRGETRSSRAPGLTQRGRGVWLP